jgi:hypothetical protein
MARAAFHAPRAKSHGQLPLFSTQGSHMTQENNAQTESVSTNRHQQIVRSLLTTWRNSELTVPSSAERFCPSLQHSEPSFFFTKT